MNFIPLKRCGLLRARHPLALGQLPSLTGGLGMFHVALYVCCGARPALHIRWVFHFGTDLLTCASIPPGHFASMLLESNDNSHSGDEHQYQCARRINTYLPPTKPRKCLKERLRTLKTGQMNRIGCDPAKG
jgi:hypothetical protein